MGPLGTYWVQLLHPAVQPQLLTSRETSADEGKSRTPKASDPHNPNT